MNTTELIATGKLKKSFVNAINKAKTTSYWFECDDEPSFFSNPFFSGEEVVLTGAEASIMLWCQLWYDRYAMGKDTEAPVSTYDNMRYAFLALNPRAYMKLLD